MGPPPSSTASLTMSSSLSTTTSRPTTFYQEHCIYLPPMAGWFLFSALLSTYNKYVFGSGKMAFPCPLLLTSIYFLVQWLFAAMLCAIFPVYFGNQRLRDMSWKEWIETSLPCGAVTAADVSLSNLSLVRVSLTFHTMVKSATPIFVVWWAFMFGIERITPTLMVVVLIIAAGEFLTVLGEVHFDVIGFFMCITASILAGARWTLVQLKLQSMDPPLKSTMATMKLLAPSMFVTSFIASLAVEQPWNKFGNMSSDESLKVVGLGLVGAFFAIAMVLCEFNLIMRASAIVLMIGGVIKEMITIIIGVYFYGDELNKINISGVAVVFAGVILYKITFHRDKHKNRGTKPDSPMANDEDEVTTTGGRLRFRRMHGKQYVTDGIFRGEESDSSFDHDLKLQEEYDEERNGGSGSGIDLVKQSLSGPERLAVEDDNDDSDRSYTQLTHEDVIRECKPPQQTLGPRALD